MADESAAAAPETETGVRENLEALRTETHGTVEELKETYRSEREELVSGSEEDRRRLQAELDDESSAREKAAEGIDAEWLARYNGILASKGGSALVSTANGVCGGCFMTLPPYLKYEAKKKSEMVICSFCGRMLY